MTVEDQEVLDFSKAVKRLMDNKDFQKVILDDFIDRQVLALGKDFDGLESELDALKAVTFLNRYLHTKLEDGKIILSNMKD